MKRTSSIKTWAFALCVLLAAAHVTAAPFSDYENIRDLYELLLQREAADNRAHEIVRKSNRSPSLRLRFGRRADPLFSGAGFLDHPNIEGAQDN